MARKVARPSAAGGERLARVNRWKRRGSAVSKRKRQAGRRMSIADQHDHAGHDHGHAHDQGTIMRTTTRRRRPDNRRRIVFAAVLTCGFMFAEAAGGLLTGSLALLADAGHMLTDSVALVLAYVAYRMGDRPGTSRMTYGFDRLKILVAYTNGLTVLAIALWIVVEAIGRIVDAVAGARRPDAGRRRARPPGECRGLRRAARRRPDVAQSARRDPACARRSSRLGRRDRRRAHHSRDRMASGRPAAFHAGGAASRRQRLAADARSGADPARGRAAADRPQRRRARYRGACGRRLDVHHMHVWTLDGKQLLATLHARLAKQRRRGAQHRRDQASGSASEHGIHHATVEVETGQACPDDRKTHKGEKAWDGLRVSAHFCTAAGQGIGRATAEAFAREGAEVIATDVASGEARRSAEGRRGADRGARRARHGRRQRARRLGRSDRRALQLRRLRASRHRARLLGAGMGLLLRPERQIDAPHHPRLPARHDGAGGGARQDRARSSTSLPAPRRSAASRTAMSTARPRRR